MGDNITPACEMEQERFCTPLTSPNRLKKRITQCITDTNKLDALWRQFMTKVLTSFCTPLKTERSIEAMIRVAIVRHPIMNPRKASALQQDSNLRFTSQPYDGNLHTYIKTACEIAKAIFFTPLISPNRLNMIVTQCITDTKVLDAIRRQFMKVN